MNVVLHPTAERQLAGVLERPGGTLLLHGPAQVGKRAAALEIARLLNCEGCGDGSCHGCKMALAGNHPNISLIEPDDKHKIGIEPIQRLQHDLHLQQYQTNGQRVIVLVDAHTATLPAQNALLKTLEEPPAGSTVLVTAISPSALLPTIISRCRLIYLPVVANALLAPLVNGSDSVLRASHGLPGRAVTLLREPEALVVMQTIDEAIGRLLDEPWLYGRMKVAGEIAKADTNGSYRSHLAREARRRARLGATGAMAAVERLNERIAANVTPKNAYEALAVELS